MSNVFKEVTFIYMSDENKKSIDENRLIAQATKGDADAFGLLYECYAGAIYRYFCVHMDNNDDAEDLTVDVFVQTWLALPTYDDRGLPFQAFLFRIARNRLIDHFRQHKPENPLNDELIDLSRNNPEDEALALGERRKMQKILNRLQVDYSKVIVLRFFSGLSTREISRMMDRSEEAVRILQYRALQALKKILAEEEFSEGK